MPIAMQAASANPGSEACGRIARRFIVPPQIILLGHMIPTFDELTKLMQQSGPVVVVFVILGYFFKVFLEKRLERFAERHEKQLDRFADQTEKQQERLADRLDEIAKTSLEVKRELRGEERGELVGFRVAVEKWEYFLQTMVFDFTMLAPSEAKVSTFYEKDKDLFLEVRLAVIKASTYLRDEKLEQQLMAAVLKIRNTYYPLVNVSMPPLIDLQAKLMPLESKLKKFNESGMQDLAFAPTPQDREEHLKLQKLMTDEMKKFSDALMAQYRSIVEQMAAVKDAINQYIYRPIKHSAINED